jgi:hypothetical protein
MNEQKIKQLTEQANLSADKIYQFDPEDGFKIQEWDKIRLEKFAELIINECLDIANDTRYDGKVVANRIKFVFGVGID